MILHFSLATFSLQNITVWDGKILDNFQFKDVRAKIF